MSFDLVIRNGTIIDGSGRPRYRADIGVAGGRIACIGRIREGGSRSIDAEGHIVAPGFIEIHSHMDAQVFWDALGTCPAWHGVTTSVMGNCGFTLAPCRQAEMDLCLRSLERAEDMSRDTLLAGVRWSWETYPEYLDAVAALPKGINYAGYVGHSALRAYVMGERAFEAVATEDDMAKMVCELEAALGAGAIGFSTSRSASHKTADGRLVASCHADWNEVRQLVSVMQRLGAGIFELAPDNWGDVEHRGHSQQRLLDLAIESGRPATFIVANILHQPGSWLEMLALAERAAQLGARMMPQVLGRQFQSVMSFKTQLPFDRLAGWSEVRRRSLTEQLAALSEPRTRARLVTEAMGGPYGVVIHGTEVRPPEWEQLAILDTPLGPYRSLAAIARERNTTPADVFIDEAITSRLEKFYVQPLANHDMEDALRQLRHPYSVIGGTDSGAHVSQRLLRAHRPLPETGPCHPA